MICLNLTALLFGLSLSWYFGGVDFSLHPDRLIGSFVSYSEKALYRTGSYKEGLFALLLTLLMVAGVTSLLIYFTKNAGKFWYFTFVVSLIYFSINERFSTYEKSGLTIRNYLLYAMPVIVYTLIAGPLGAVLYRTLPIYTRMLPVKVEKFSQFSKPASQVYDKARDIPNMLVPVILWITDLIKAAVKKLKRFRP